MDLGCTRDMWFTIFPALTLAPHMVHVDQIPFEVVFMSSFMSSSTVKFLFFASSLTFNAVSFLIVREYQPFSGIDLPSLLVCFRLTGQLEGLARLTMKKGAI